MKRDFLTITDFSSEEIKEVFKLAEKLKKGKIKPKPLKHKVVACLFEKPSLRTRISFEVGIAQLGGRSLYISKDEISLGKRESIHDVAKVLSRYVDMIIIRTFSQADVEQLAKHSDIPVINGLTDLFHPCQVMGDMFSIIEKKGRIDNLIIAYLGDGNNVANSWIDAASRIPISLRIGTSEQTLPNRKVLDNAKKTGMSQIDILHDPQAAVKDADVIYTDVWASMGQKHLADERTQFLSIFQVNSQLLKLAKRDCIVMHCLPANRGEEITDEIIDGPQSIVFDQAENRLHIQKAIMLKLLS
jgi:ornithine carbamoyltransferase